jgi:hypothetical protein
MQFMGARGGRSGSVEQAARRIYEMLDREEREKRRGPGRPKHAADGPRQRPNTASREPVENGFGAERKAPRAPGSTNQRAGHPGSRPQGHRPSRREPETHLGPPAEYGPFERIGDLLRGVGRDEYKHFVGGGAAQSEMVGSQMPGRERGPADAYRHVLWAAELTRRFGEARARQILDLHEQEGQLKDQPEDEEAMDRRNNEVGIAIGRFARDWRDVVSAARKAMSGSAADGSGAWKPTYEPASTLAPYGPTWLSEDRWVKNPKDDNWKRPYGRPHAAQPPELRDERTNWYTNPDRPDGPDWTAGYLPDGYQYPYGLPAHAVGPNDPRLLRAIGAYNAYIDRLR